MSTVPTNTDDVIYSRDVIERLEELRSQMVDDSPEAEPFTDEDREELRILEELNKQGENYAADWQYGETLVRDSYFKEYAQDLAEDIGALNPDAGWPNSYIDWDGAAEALRMDYTPVEFDGVTYWVR